MLNHLKSLPLTIVITILIWMYAEAQFTSTHGITLDVPDVPVWISGPPGLVARYNVDLRTKFVRVTVEGPEPAIQALQQRIAAKSQGYDIHAYLDISPGDAPSDNYSTRKSRIVLPVGLTLQSTSPEVEFRLMDRAAPPATQLHERPD